MQSTQIRYFWFFHLASSGGCPHRLHGFIVLAKLSLSLSIIYRSPYRSLFNAEHLGATVPAIIVKPIIVINAIKAFPATGTLNNSMAAGTPTPILYCVPHASFIALLEIIFSIYAYIIKAHLLHRPFFDPQYGQNFGLNFWNQ